MIAWILSFIGDVVLPATDNVWAFLTTELSDSIPVIGGLSLISILAGGALIAVIVYLIVRTLTV